MKRIFYSLAVCAVVALAATSCSNKARCWKMELNVPSLNINEVQYFWGTEDEVSTESTKMISKYYSTLGDKLVGTKVNSTRVNLNKSECQSKNDSAE